MGGNEEFCFNHVKFYSLLGVSLKKSSKQPDMQVWSSGERMGPEIEILEKACVDDILSHEIE